MNEFTLGKHEARIANIERDVGVIREEVHTLVLAEERRKGAWRTAAVIGGGAGSLLALVVRFLVG